MTDIENLLKYFITANIINTDDQSEILAPPKLTSKVTLLLKHISGPLEFGDTKPFRMMLDIMEKHGNLATKSLAISVKKCLMTSTIGIPTTELFVVIYCIEKKKKEVDKSDVGV